MPIISKSVFTVAALTFSALISFPAIAASMIFDFVSSKPETNVRFEFAQGARPIFNIRDISVFSVVATTRHGVVNGFVEFVTSELGGGFAFTGSSVVYANTFGVQLFSGDTNNPIFSPGRFAREGFYDGAPGVLTISSGAAAAVPEPATWMMMIGGFGIVGGAMRRRQKITVRFA